MVLSFRLSDKSRDTLEWEISSNRESEQLERGCICGGDNCPKEILRVYITQGVAKTRYCKVKQLKKEGFGLCLNGA